MAPIYDRMSAVLRREDGDKQSGEGCRQKIFSEILGICLTTRWGLPFSSLRLVFGQICFLASVATEEHSILLRSQVLGWDSG